MPLGYLIYKRVPTKDKDMFGRGKTFSSNFPTYLVGKAY